MKDFSPTPAAASLKQLFSAFRPHREERQWRAHGSSLTIEDYLAIPTFIRLGRKLLDQPARLLKYPHGLGNVGPADFPFLSAPLWRLGDQKTLATRFLVFHGCVLT